MIYTPVYYKTMQAICQTDRFVSSCGGTRSGKTFANLQAIYELAIQDEVPTLTSVVSETFPHLKRGAIRDRDKILPKLQMFARVTKQRPHSHNAIVYTLVNFTTTLDQDLDRIYTLRDLGYWPYVMIYDKEHCAKVYRHLQRWVNMRATFAAVKRFEDYNA